MIRLVMIEQMWITNFLSERKMLLLKKNVFRIKDFACFYNDNYFCSESNMVSKKKVKHFQTPISFPTFMI